MICHFQIQEEFSSCTVIFISRVLFPYVRDSSLNGENINHIWRGIEISKRENCNCNVSLLQIHSKYKQQQNWHNTCFLKISTGIAHLQAIHYIRLLVEETSCWQKSIVKFLAAVFVFLIIQSVATVNWGVGSVFHPQKIHIYFNMYVHFNFDKLAAYFGRKTISLDENIYFVQFNKRRSWVSWEGLTKEIFCCPSWYSQILHKLTLSLKSLNKSAPIFAE